MAQDSRVLIVEDDDVLRVMLFTVLRHQAVAVDTATSAADALDRVLTCDYALILLDLEMAGGEGQDFLRRYAEERPESTSFVIAIRNAETEAPIHRRIGAVLTKPLEIDTLAELVRECAAVVPLPEEPLQCPPAESNVRARLDRSGSFYSN